MDLSRFYLKKDEKPLDNIITDGGLCSIFRTIGCVGDSLSSGEYESCDKDGNRGYHDFYEDSWGQHIARAAGCKVYNFSKGGMTAKEYVENFAEARGFWDTDKLCQAYIMALGVNDILNRNQPLGDISDIDKNDYNNNADTFCGNYCRIIQRYKEMQPRARFFLVAIPHHTIGDERADKVNAHAELLHKIAAEFDNVYVIDLAKYGPLYDEEFCKHFFMGSHMNPLGYVLSAQLISSYIDYIIRANPEEFFQTGFIGTELYYKDLPY